MNPEFEFDGFSKELCRSMVALMDVDRSGKLGLDEFIQLWKSVRTWKVSTYYYKIDKKCLMFKICDLSFGFYCESQLIFQTHFHHSRSVLK
jgi:hypothetical protein